MTEKCSVHLKNGSYLEGGYQQNFYFFKGIPYAEPPVGALRFKPPVPLSKIPENLLNCKEHRSISIQLNMRTSQIIGSEDCLYLNVYSPKLRGPKLPVMVWIHGGMHRFGSGNSDEFSPEFLIANDVIVVTMNYRLSALGFLYNPKVGIYGNMGLKDQRLALKWVHENISDFGGDPGNVTLFSESSGGICVNYHLMNGESRKYFHKAIMQSSNAFSIGGLQINPIEKSINMAKRLGAKNESQMLDVLMNSQPEQIEKAVNSCIPDSEFREGEYLPFRPVIETHQDKDSFIVEHPMNALKKFDLFQGIPIITGTCNIEGLFSLRRPQKALQKYLENKCRFVPRSLNLSFGSQTCEKVADEIFDEYFKNAKNDDEKYFQNVVFHTDRIFRLPMYKLAELIARYQPNSKHFIYKFAFDGKLNIGSGKKKVSGASHADDLRYMFGSKSLKEVESDSDEAKFRETFCRLWTNFAKFGDPTPDDEFGFKWDPTDPVDPKAPKVDYKVLELNKICKMLRNPDEEMLRFWMEIFKTWNGDFLKSKPKL